MCKKNIAKRIIVILIGASIILGLFNYAYAAGPEDYRKYNRADKPKANFAVTVIKPDGNNRYTNPTSPETGYDLAYDANGNPLNLSLIKKVTAYVGDTLSFSDMSTVGSGSSLTACDFQWYSSQTSGKAVQSISQFNSRTFSLTQPGKWQLYYNVRDNYFPEGSFGNWSDNGCHITTDYNNSDFPDGMYWYFTRVDIEVLPATTAGTVTTIYRGWGNDGSVAEIKSRKVTNHTINGDASISVTESAPTITGYDFVSSAIGSSESALTDILNGATSRTVQIDPQNPHKYIVFTYQQKSTGTPSLGITANPMSVTPGQAYTVSDLSRPSEGAASITKWRVKEEFTPKNGGASQTILSERDITSPGAFFKSYSKTSEGTYTYTVTAVTDNLNRLRTGAASVSVVVSQTPHNPNNKPPVAIIDAPDEVRIGEEFAFSGAGSYDEDGEIVKYIFNNQSANIGYIGDTYQTIWYGTKGSRTLYLTVEDDQGARSSASHRINVIDPYIYAGIGISGTLKENRRVDIYDDSNSPDHYPVVKEKTKWTITPISGGTADDIKYYGGLTGVSAKQVVFKKAGLYKITLSVENTYGFTDTAERIITIAPDQDPVANFNVAASTLRNPDESNLAKISLTDASYTPDGDIISQRIWSYAYDSDNDGSFDDESWIVIDSGNNQKPSLYVSQVGRYKFELNVKETFGQPTIEAFISSSDYKSGTTAYKSESSKVCEVINAAPSAAFNVYHKKKIDLQILVDDIMASGLQSNIALLKKKLIENHIDAEITIDTIGNEGIGNARKLRSIDAASYTSGTIVNGNFVDIVDSFTAEDHLGLYKKETHSIASNQLYEYFTNDESTELYAVSRGNNRYGFNGFKIDYYRYDIITGQQLAHNSVNMSSYLSSSYIGMRFVYAADHNGIINVVVAPYYEDSYHDTYYTLYLVTFDALTGSALTVSPLMTTFLSSDSMSRTYGYIYGGNSNFIGASFDRMSYYFYNGSEGNIIEYQIGTNKILSKIPVTTAGAYHYNYHIYNFNKGTKIYMLLDPWNGDLNRLYEFDMATHQCKFITSYNGSDASNMYFDKEANTLGVRLNRLYYIYDINHQEYSNTLYGIDIYQYKNGATAIGHGFVDDYLLIYISYKSNGNDIYNYLLFKKDGTYVGCYDLGASPLNSPSIKWGYFTAGYNIYDIIQARASVLYDKLITHTSADIPSYRVVMLKDKLYPEVAYNVARIVNEEKLNMLLMPGSGSAELQSFKNILTSKSAVTNAALSMDVNININTIADYIISKNIPEKVSSYVLLDEPLDYETFYSDYEGDPQYEGRWKFTHTDPYCFDNSMGLSSIHNQYLESPIVSFDKVGKYTATHQVRDNPKDDARFDNYKLWSSEKNIELYVHRRPYASFALSVKPGGAGYYIPVLSDSSYDLDHTSRSDKGIIEWKWAWRESGSSEWTSGMPASFIIGKTYIVQLQVKDLEGAWSVPTEKTLDTGSVNLPPTVDADPQSMSSDCTITVTVTADDLGENDFNHTRYIWSRYTSKPSSGWITTTSKVFQTAISTEGTWYLHMEAFDNSGQSFYRYRGPYTLVPNQPPTVTITSICPSVIYEGDSVTITYQPGDPNNDMLTAQAVLYKGSTQIWSSNTTIAPTGGYNPVSILVLNSADTGSYRFTVTVTDPAGLTASDTINFSVNGLNITGEVRHTDLWNNHRQNYNRSKTGNPESPRGYSVFFPGERFLLSAVTTAIDPARPDLRANSVTCQLIGTSFTSAMTGAGTTWTGSIWDQSMVTWSDRSLTFRFAVTYSNGTVKTHDVPVSIVDDAYWRLHMLY